MPATATPADSAARAYRFQRFRTALLIDEMTFGPGVPGPGDRVPSFNLPVLDGGRLSSSDLGGRPVLLAVGSRTCPVTESSGPVLRRLHAQFGDKIRFVLVNTREAHPGDLFGQPQTPEEKWAHATELRRHHDIPFEVAVDDIDGTLHRALTPKPNSAYLLDPAGIIRYRAHWANDERGLRGALSAQVQGRDPARAAAAGQPARCCAPSATCPASSASPAARSNATHGPPHRRWPRSPGCHGSSAGSRKIAAAQRPPAPSPPSRSRSPR
jgi:hypothetical protein